jgi:hypothetical protein
MGNWADWRLRGWLREQPPVWRRGGEEADEWGRRRWERELEPFENGATAELYPAATVLDDLAAAEDDNATLRILARYAVARVVTLAGRGLLQGAKLKTERRIASEHIALLPAHDWERQGLERLLGLCVGTREAAVVEALVIVAEAAAKREHIMGAFALYREGYDQAIARAWWREASVAARGIGRLARLEEARYSARLWDRRASVLERRADRWADEQQL